MALVAVLFWAAAAAAIPVTVSIENLSPTNGAHLTPLWVGFHDGSFDLYNINQPASPALERLAEDGNAEPLSNAFQMGGAGTTQGVLSGSAGPIAPGEMASMTFDLDGTLDANRYFSYAAMVIPSNDAFIANGNPRQHTIFNPNGMLLGADFIVRGVMVLDAGTEVNTEIPEQTAFFGQTVADTGVDENGLVRFHEGFQDPAAGGILSDLLFAGADFRGPGYELAHITVSNGGDMAPVPEPATILLLGSGLLGLIGIGRKRQD